MAKTKMTKTLESMLEMKFDKRSDFYVFECTYGWAGDEIVDCVMYDTNRVVHCYELKQTVSDFHSNAKLSFFGHKNYFVMPYALYEKVKDEIPDYVGCYVLCKRTPKHETTTNEYGISKTIHSMEIADGTDELFCIKAAKKVELKCDREILLSSMLRSISNETNMMVRDHYKHSQTTEETWEKRLDKKEREITKLRNYVFNLEHTINNMLSEYLGGNATYENKLKEVNELSLGSIENIEALKSKGLGRKI